ncbi:MULTISPECIES: hypothetical protein [Paracoccus]|jgi:hypothetical protein|uniref:Uncharacterized protein n=1 Tax=Paracoccus litorisediminis TaxID=2006130 RepID=A0A844HGB0_9RHOB|nr:MULTISPECIES: hypothetical protein [Paracoccus]MBD9525429.1 hypothetical protein [Paracoccus sp. PAR01]MTH57859.1 hypothetical protein [Paracoccus litorisediminis]
MRLRTRRLFLGRDAYRRRRMIDATRILPVVFALIVLLPPIWLPHYFSFATGTLWLGTGWFVTILITAILHRAIGSASEDDDDS